MDRAVVIGASVTGSLCAAVLAARASEVVVVERDDLGGGNAPRRAVPQGRHLHALYPTGLEVMERLLPGLTDRLVASGAVLGDPGWDVGWWQYGARRVPVPTGRLGVLCSRPLLETELRTRALARPGVQLVAGNVRRLTLSGGAVDGVVLADDEGRDGHRISADLVVDCSGRGSRLGAWLTELGYPPPATREVGVDIGYATRMFRRQDGSWLTDGTAGLVSLPELPERPRMCVALAVEDERWIVGVMGIAHDRPRDDPDEFRRRVMSEPPEPLHDLVASADPVSEVITYRFPTSIRRDVHRLARFPDRLFAAGDTIASFNPIYGQGMTCAARHAVTLATHLDRHGPERSAAGYFKQIDRTTEMAWNLSVTEDFRLASTTGPRPRGVAFAHWYGGHYSRACLTDRQLHRRFLEVASMRAASTHLMTPPSLLRVARGRHTRPSQPRVTAGRV